MSNPTLLLQHIQDTFPELHWDSYEYITVGWDHEVIILDQKIVFRFPREPEYLEQLKLQIGVLEKLGSLVRATIPQYIFVAPDLSFAGYPIVPGAIITEGFFQSMSSPDKKAFAEQLADFLSTLHTVIAQGHDFSSVHPSDIADNADQEEMSQQADQYLPMALSENEFATVKKILADFRSLNEERLPKVLIHGDVYRNHLLWEEQNRHFGIIDFSDMNLGDPAFDFAELYDYGADFVNEVYGRYTGPKDDTFLERARLYRKWVGIHMMVDHFQSHKTTFEVARQTFDRAVAS